MCPTNVLDWWSSASFALPTSVREDLIPSHSSFFLSTKIYNTIFPCCSCILVIHLPVWESLIACNAFITYKILFSRIGPLRCFVLVTKCPQLSLIRELAFNTCFCTKNKCLIDPKTSIVILVSVYNITIRRKCWEEDFDSGIPDNTDFFF